MRAVNSRGNIREFSENHVWLNHDKTAQIITLYTFLGPIIYLMEKADRFIYKTCPFVAGGIFIGSVYWTAVTYGAVTVMQVYLSLVMRKLAFCICENKDTDQLHGNREADQQLCFRYIESTIPLLSKSELSSL